MKLSYRGGHYEYNPLTLEVTEGEILGSYRGATWRCRTLKEVPVPQPDVTLCYRGTTYNPRQAARLTSANTGLFRAANALKAVSVPDALPVYREIGRIHCSNLHRNLERRLQVAKEQGNKTLISLLEAESKQLACLR